MGIREKKRKHDMIFTVTGLLVTLSFFALTIYMRTGIFD
jgi:hypothetical protein